MKRVLCCVVVAAFACELLAQGSKRAEGNVNNASDQDVRDQKQDSPSGTTTDTALKKLVSAKVEEMNNALLEGEFAKIVELTHPKVIEMAGGREKMISAIASGTKEMKSKGFAMRSNKVEEPSDPVKSGSVLFIVVPHIMEMKAPNGKLLVKGFVIGVSNDQGKSWKFVNGDGDLKQIKQVLPNLPEELKLPERQKPVFEKD